MKRLFFLFSLILILPVFFAQPIEDLVEINSMKLSIAGKESNVFDLQNASNIKVELQIESKSIASNGNISLNLISLDSKNSNAIGSIPYSLAVKGSTGDKKDINMQINLSSFSQGSYELRAEITPSPLVAEDKSNNVLSKSITLTKSSKPISISEFDMLLLPFIALISLALIFQNSR